MKIEHRNETAEPGKDLSHLDKRRRYAAIIVAFAGTFVWFFKILFF
jgi:hypothetical protein